MSQPYGLFSGRDVEVAGGACPWLLCCCGAGLPYGSLRETFSEWPLSGSETALDCGNNGLEKIRTKERHEYIW